MKRVSSYKRLTKERNRWIAKLKAIEPKVILRGSIRIQGNRCGKKRCRCKRKGEAIYHGPYAYLSFRGRISNHSIFLTKDKMVYSKEAIKNYQELTKIIIEISDINFQILRYYYHKLKEE